LLPNINEQRHGTSHRSISTTCIMCDTPNSSVSVTTMTARVISAKGLSDRTSIVKNGVFRQTAPVEDRPIITEIKNALLPLDIQGVETETRWMRCYLKNDTPFPILISRTHFYSGRFYDAPSSNIVEPHQEMMFSVCNRDGSSIGAYGGTSFIIRLADNLVCPFAIGWSNQSIDDFRAGFTCWPTGPATLPSALDGAQSIVSHGTAHQKSDFSYQKYDKSGKPTTSSEFYFTASPGQISRYSVSEICY